MNHDHKKHLLIILACCLVPLALILSMGIFGLSLGALPSLVPFALVLICPLMMILMMRGLRHDHGNAPHSPKTQVTLSDAKASDETIVQP